MIRFGIKILAVVLLSTAVVSCAALRPRQRVENPGLANVKFAYVTADQGLPVAILGNVQTQLAASIASTYRTVATDPVYLTVRVSNIGLQQGAKMPVYTVVLNTILSDARDGRVVASRDLQAYAIVPRGKSLNDQIAGAITERLRFTYNLASPQPQDVAIAMPRKTSTQIAIDQPDALLNATTRIEPEDTLPPGTADPLLAKPAPAVQKSKPVGPAVAPAVATVNPDFIGPVLPARTAPRIMTTIAPKPAKDPVPAKVPAAAKAEPAAGTVTVPAMSNLENGAVSKIVIPASKASSPATEPATPAASTGDEPCVVTLENDCAIPQ